jgi:hypothetical protein
MAVAQPELMASSRVTVQPKTSEVAATPVKRSLALKTDFFPAAATSEVSIR